MTNETSYWRRYFLWQGPKLHGKAREINSVYKIDVLSEIFSPGKESGKCIPSD